MEFYNPLNKPILHIALPAIVANITVPLLGLIDTAISGHLGKTEYIGAISVGTMMFNLIYWNFSFLRMGTSGITAQAYGSKNPALAATTLIRAVSLALIISFAIIALQYPLQWIALKAIAPSQEVKQLAQSYFFICVWNAPAILSMMAIKGWFLGMQDSTRPMYISICVNVANIAASLVAVFVLKLGFIGIAIGTLIASYIGLFLALFYIIKKHKGILTRINWRETLEVRELGLFFNVNRDIFIRSLCLMLVTLFFTAQGARSGDVTLAANTLMMQLFILFSYFMDGFAFAGEALVGKYTGAKELNNRNRCIRQLFYWGTAIATLFSIVYATGLHQIFSLLTNDTTVIATAMTYYWWCVAIPFAGMAAFVWDGVFIGMTATRGMLIAIATASATFFCLFYLVPGENDNNRLWLSFIAYLAMRGISQTVLFFTHYDMNKQKP